MKATSTTEDLAAAWTCAMNPPALRSGAAWSAEAASHLLETIIDRVEFIDRDADRARADELPDQDVGLAAVP